MGFLGKLLKRKKDIAPDTKDTRISESKNGGAAFSAEDFQYSKSIYNRNLLGIHIYELQPIPPDGSDGHYDMVLGEFIEITEGLLTFGVITKSDGSLLFAAENKLTVSYTRHGESFFTKAMIVEAYPAAEETVKKDDDNTIAGIQLPPDAQLPEIEVPKKYIVQAVLCAEPVRHRRKHGRIAIKWTVFFEISDSNQGGSSGDEDFSSSYAANTLDISEGGFKGRVSRHFKRGTVIKCSVDTDEGESSSGELIGEVIRCYHMAGTGYTHMYEMTVRFIAMDDEVREFLRSRIEKSLPAAVNAEARITTTENDEQALIELLPPQNNGVDLTYEQLVTCLEVENITYGVDYDLLRSLADNPCYNLEYIVARCTFPEHGDDAVLTYYVDMDPKFIPKVNEDGTADFKDLGIIHKVSKGEILAEKIPPTPGTDGKSVTGGILAAIPGKDHKLPGGKGTAEDETGTALLAGIDGFISIVNHNINVLNTYIVEGDVQYSTGNIDHNGIVIVKGDVRSGFSVTAEGDIIIHGSVESAAVKAGGTVVIHGGCVGEGSNVEAAGNVAIKFIDGGSVKTEGSLTTSYILAARVKCGGSVDMVDIGLIRNSHVTARTAINAKTIGGARSAANKTIAEVGNDPALRSRYKTVVRDLEKLEKELETIRTGIRTLTMMKYKKELSKDKLALMEQFKLLTQQHAQQIADLTDSYDSLNTQIDELGYGDVNVSDIAYEGLMVIIGPCELVLQDEVKAARFHRVDNKVQISSLGDKSDKPQGLLRSSDL